jgi:hypothetical protein
LTFQRSFVTIPLLVGPPGHDVLRLLIATGCLLAGGGLAAFAVYTQIQDGGRLRELVNRLRDPLRHLAHAGLAAPADRLDGG